MTAIVPYLVGDLGDYLVMSPSSLQEHLPHPGLCKPQLPLHLLSPAHPLLPYPVRVTPTKWFNLVMENHS